MLCMKAQSYNVGRVQQQSLSTVDVSELAAHHAASLIGYLSRLVPASQAGRGKLMLKHYASAPGLVAVDIHKSATTP